MTVVYLLNPRYYDTNLFSNSMNTISQFVEKYYSEDLITIWQQLTQYKTKSGIFLDQLVWTTVNEVDLVVWQNANFKESATKLSNMAARILSIPMSSAAAERNWSAFSYIHDKK